MSFGQSAGEEEGHREIGTGPAHSCADGVNLNEVLGSDCPDVHMEIAWDMWARVRIFCPHGTAEGVSGGLCLNEAFVNALKSWGKVKHPFLCYERLPAPKDVVERHSLSVVECDLFAGHEGEHQWFREDDDEQSYRYERLVYFANGHERTNGPVLGTTGLGVIPHPYRDAYKRVSGRGVVAS